MTELPSIGIKYSHEWKNWLNSFPSNVRKDVAALVSLRAVLRTTVFLSLKFCNNKSKLDKLRCLLFRAIITTKILIGNDDKELQEFASILASNIFEETSNPLEEDMLISGIVSGAAIAIKIATGNIDSEIPNFDKTVEGNSYHLFITTPDIVAFAAVTSLGIRSAFDAKLKIGSVFLDAVTADVVKIEATNNPLVLASSKLWLVEPPMFWRDEYEAFRTELATLHITDSTNNPHWKVWSDWFDDIAIGRNSFDLPTEIAKALDRRIALGDGRPDFWDRKPGEINCEIAGWVEEANREALGEAAKTDDDNGALTQRVAPHHYEDKDGRIVAKPLKSTAASNDFSLAIWAETKEKIDATRARLKRTQTPQHIIDTLDRLYECLAGSFAEMNPGVLLMRGKTLEAILAAYSLESMSAELPGDALALISDLADSLGDLKALFPEIIKLEAERIAQKIASGQAAAIFEKTQEIAAIAKAADIVDQSVNDAFEAALGEILESQRVAAEAKNPDARATAIEKEAHQIAFASLDTRNFAARLIKSAKQGAKKAGVDVSGRIYKGALDGIEEGTKATTKAGIVFLVGQVAGPLAALATLAAMFNPLAKEAKKIGEKETKEHTTEV